MVVTNPLEAATAVEERSQPIVAPATACLLASQPRLARHFKIADLQIIHTLLGCGGAFLGSALFRIELLRHIELFDAPSKVVGVRKREKVWQRRPGLHTLEMTLLICFSPVSAIA